MRLSKNPDETRGLVCLGFELKSSIADGWIFLSLI